MFVNVHVYYNLYGYCIKQIAKKKMLSYVTKRYFKKNPVSYGFGSL